MTQIFSADQMPEVTDNKKGPKPKWPFDDIEVGQFFVVEDESKHSTMRVYASSRGKALGKKFRTRLSDGKLFIQRTA